MVDRRATVLGPGPRLAALARCLRTADGAPPAQLEDLAQGLALGGASPLTAGESLDSPPSVGWLVLDVAAVPHADLGLLRRIRAAAPGLRILWTAGADELAGLAAVAEPEDAFRPWPLDVTRLPGFDGAEVAAPAPAPRAARAAAEPAQRGAGHRAAADGARRGLEQVDPQLRQIEAILAGLDRLPATLTPLGAARDSAGLGAGAEHGEFGELGDWNEDDDEAYEELEDLDEAPRPSPSARGMRAASPFADTGPLLTRAELEAFTAPAATEWDRLGLERGAPPSAEVPPSAPHGAPNGAAHGAAGKGLPRWYRDQVADLADLVQRTELALHAVELGGELDEARHEVGRLRQFARTLGCLAAPPRAPAAGGALVDLGVLVEETLASLAQRVGPEAARPKFLFRADPGLQVRADKVLLVAALDAVLQAAAASGEASDVIRTEVRRAEGDVVEVRVDLPEGRLAGLEPAQILEPYALKGRLAGVGANALAAAGGILVGHGGDLELQRRVGGRLVFSLRLPGA